MELLIARFHVVHCMLDQRRHGLRGFAEIAQSLVWGLRALGHEADSAVNAFHPRAVNIVLGAQVLPQAVLDRLPDDTIVYNHEQLRGLDAEQIRPSMHEVARRFRIWDYSAANLDAWRRLGAARVTRVPTGYAPTLTRIPRSAVQDIDVLMYGLTGPKRLQCLDQLSGAGVAVVFLSGLYGDGRDSLIARSRLVLNVTLYEHARIFEIARVSYLLANRKAVVSVREAGASIEPDMEGAVRFTTQDALTGTVDALLQDDGARARLEDTGFELFSRRDLRDILATALADLPG